jgi:hypothetical protein
MKNIKILTLLFLLTLPLMANAQTLPAKVKSYLNQNYKGWKLTGKTDGCGAEFSKSAVSGDFDGNRKSDYAIKFIAGKRGYIIAFLNQGTNYKPVILENETAKGIINQGLSIARKGETYGEIVNDDFDRVTRRLANDAPVGGTCESSAYLYIYRNGNFKRAFTSD